MCVSSKSAGTASDPGGIKLQGLLSEIQSQSLAVTVVYVPSSGESVELSGGGVLRHQFDLANLARALSAP